MDNRRENLNKRLDFYHLHWSRNKIFFEEGAKILSIRKCKNPTFIYTSKEAYTMMSINIIKTERINLQFLSLVLNSKLIEFWLRNKGKMQGENFQIDKEPLLLIPINKPKDEKPFIILYSEIVILNQKNKNFSHILKKIDIMIYKLYELSFEEVQLIDNSISLNDFQSN